MNIVTEVGTLKGVCKTNSWGKPASTSMVSLFGASATDMPLHGPLAELWFGIHSKGTARFVSNDNQEILLDQKLQSTLGRSELSYLAKILSVEHILSIQLHPDENTAKKLHQERPQSYPDSSAKPEMAIALGDASLLCGVRPLDEIKHLLSAHPGFKSLGIDAMLSTQEDVRQLVACVLELSREKVELFYNATIRGTSFEIHDSIAQAAYEYLGCFDPGIPLLYLFSHVTLKKGDAVFIEAGIPHAYISGDLFECMKCSDNVVRGGLTPKEVDRKVFADLVQVSPYDSALPPIASDEKCRRYEPKGCSFVVEHIRENESIRHDLAMNSGTALLVCVSGAGEVSSGNVSSPIEKGSALFLLGGTSEFVLEGENMEVFLVFEK